MSTQRSAYWSQLSSDQAGAITDLVRRASSSPTYHPVLTPVTILASQARHHLRTLFFC
jgi:hypothetical protein